MEKQKAKGIIKESDGLKQNSLNKQNLDSKVKALLINSMKYTLQSKVYKQLATQQKQKNKITIKLPDFQTQILNLVQNETKEGSRVKIKGSMSNRRFNSLNKNQYQGNTQSVQTVKSKSKDTSRANSILRDKLTPSKESQSLAKSRPKIKGNNSNFKQVQNKKIVNKRTKSQPFNKSDINQNRVLQQKKEDFIRSKVKSFDGINNQTKNLQNFQLQNQNLDILRNLQEPSLDRFLDMSPLLTTTRQFEIMDIDMDFSVDDIQSKSNKQPKRPKTAFCSPKALSPCMSANL